MWLFLSSQDLAKRLDEITTIFEGAQKAFVVLTSFLTVGIGGLFLAFRGVMAQIRSVEKRVDPAVTETHEIRHEVSDGGEDTLRQRIEQIAAAMESEQKLREEQHTGNSERLDSIAADVTSTKEDIQTMRTLLMKLLGKAAGL